MPGSCARSRQCPSIDRPDRQDASTCALELLEDRRRERIPGEMAYTTCAAAVGGHNESRRAPNRIECERSGARARSTA